MKAFSEGIVIEFSAKSEINPEWAEVIDALWLDSCNYRIKPEFSKGDIVAVSDNLGDTEMIRVFKEYTKTGEYISYSHTKDHGNIWAHCRKFEP